MGDEKFGDHEAHIGQEQMEEAARGEVIEKPSLMQIVKVCFSLQVLVCGACYFCSFGGELAFNSILGSYYRKNFPSCRSRTMAIGQPCSVSSMLPSAHSAVSLPTSSASSTPTTTAQCSVSWLPWRSSWMVPMV